MAIHHVLMCALELGRVVVFSTSGQTLVTVQVLPLPTHILTHIHIVHTHTMWQVRELAHLVNSGLEVITCGSYRRGKPTCGDVDILVTHSDGRSHRGVLPRLVQEGKDSGEDGRVTLWHCVPVSTLINNVSVCAALFTYKH